MFVTCIEHTLAHLAHQAPCQDQHSSACQLLAANKIPQVNKDSKSKCYASLQFVTESDSTEGTYRSKIRCKALIAGL